MTELYDLTNEALRRWVTTTGVDPEGSFHTLGQWDVQRVNNWIRTAQDADSTGLTTYLYLRASARDYVSKREIDALSLIEDMDAVQRELEPMRLLIEALKHPTLVEAAEGFQRQLRNAAEDQGVLDQTGSLIDNLSELGHIRLDALYALRILRRNTFARGPRRSDHLRYNRRVLKFWNVNSLVRALEFQPEDGISLCLLRDPQVIEHSFFAFAMRDGDLRTIWSDVPNDSHPMQKHMSRDRSRARSLNERAGKLRFPYQLLDVKYDDEQGIFSPDTSGTSLVRTNVEAVTIAGLGDLPPDQIIWALMMFDLLRYQPEHEGELSCTGETIFLALTGSSQKALGTIEPLRRADVTGDAIQEQLTRAKEDGRAFLSSGQNSWMEERYADKVDESVYNLFGTTDTSLARLPGSDVPVELKRKKKELSHFESDESRALVATDAMGFGTATEMKDNRLWMARYNQAVRVQELANKEFKRRQEKVWEWYAKHVRANLDWFVDAACRATATVTTPRILTMSSWIRDTHENGDVTVETIHWQRFSRGDDPISWYDGFGGNVTLFTPRGRRISESPARCPISGEIASVWTLFQPPDAAALRTFAGGVALPDVLEHWSKERSYEGNCILDRTDPMDSMVKNPWRDIPFRVLLGLSLREFRRQCKARGIKHPEDFATLKQEGYRGESHWETWRYEQRRARKIKSVDELGTDDTEEELPVEDAEELEDEDVRFESGESEEDEHEEDDGDPSESPPEQTANDDQALVDWLTNELGPEDP